MSGRGSTTRTRLSDGLFSGSRARKKAQILRPPATDATVNGKAGHIQLINAGDFEDVQGISLPAWDVAGLEMVCLFRDNKTSAASGNAIDHLQVFNDYDTADPEAKTLHWDARIRVMDPLTGQRAVGSETGRSNAPDTNGYIGTSQTSWDVIEAAFIANSGNLRLATRPGAYIVTVHLDITWT